jgi:hypothetical protein
MAGGRDAEDALGGKLAGRVAEYLSRIALMNRDRATGTIVKQAMAAQHEFFRLTGSEVRRTVSPLWRMIGEHPDAPQWVRDTGLFVAEGRGQWATMLAGTATGAAMGSGLVSLLTNEMTPVLGAVIASNPNIRLSPAEAAAAMVRGLSWGPDLATDAASQGINSNRFDTLKALNTQVLSPGEIVELYRRGELDYAAALRFFHRAGFDGDHARRMLTLYRQHISLPEAAQMWNRSIVDDGELRDIGRVNGFTAEDARRYSELGGEPPAPEVLYTAFRRGFIDQARLRRGIVQGPIRNEWFDVLEKLQYRSMTPTDAGQAVTQGHMTVERAQQIAKEYGINPADMAIMIETSGRPPGLEFAAEAFHRGFLTEKQWEAMFLESAVKNRYIPVMRQMRTRLMPQETARSLLQKGVITAQRCAQILTRHGFERQDVEAFIEASTMDKSSATRDLSLATIRELYAEQEISREDAHSLITGLGFDDTEAEWHIELADIARIRTYRNAVISRVRAAYVKGFLDDVGASTTLDSLAVPPARVGTLLTLWQIERQTVTRDLTPAQIVAAAKRNLMDASVAADRLVGQGYDQDDAVILLKIAGVVDA